MYKLCRFDLVPNMDHLYDTYMGFPEHVPLTPGLGEIGYESHYFVYNLGSQFIFWCVGVVYFLSILILSCVPKFKDRAKKWL
jgi:hypothetical protein